MAALTATILDEEVPRARVSVLLNHFSELGDDRDPWRVMYPLKEVLLLVVCATIASCDDFDDIVAWGKHQQCRWIVSTRHYPGEPGFKTIKSLLKVYARAEYRARCTFEIRYYISSAPLDIE